MRIRVSHLVLKTNKEIKQSPSQLRGYFGHKFEKYPVLHNHYGDENFLYSYPLVQYQVTDGQASILGIEEGSDILNEIAPTINELKLKDSYYKVEDYLLLNKEYNINGTNKKIQYEFITPWLALNSNNFQKYKNIKDWKERKIMINNIMAGNILSMSKGLGIIVDRKIYVKSYVEPVYTRYKSINMLGFTGEFRVNFKIPDFFGFGKGVSNGFGTVKRILDDDKSETPKEEKINE